MPPRETWLIYGKWTLVRLLNHSGVPYLVLTNGEVVDYPILYEGSTVAVFDNPDRIPVGLKTKVSAVMRRKRQQGYYPFYS